MEKNEKIKNPFLRVDLLFDENIKELKKEIEEEKAEERRRQKEILRGAIKEK